MRDVKLVAIAIALIVCLVAGEVYIYTFDGNKTYSIDGELQGSEVVLELDSGVPLVYDTVLFGNGSFKPISECYVYYDPGYTENLSEVDHATGGKTLTQDYYVSQMILQLKNRGVDPIQLNASELGTKLNTDVASADCHKALIVVSGALPDSIYDGNTGSLVKTWIDAGGCLYWAGNYLGEKISTTNGLIDATCNPMMEFFGTDNCYNRSGSVKGYDEMSNGFRTSLSLMSNGLAYALDVSGMTDTLQIGYTDGTYSSITLVKCGAGMICVVAGDYSNTQRSDLVQTVASHICYSSQIIGDQHGELHRNKTVTVELPVGGTTGNISAYAYLGGYYLEYARCTDFEI